MASKIPEIRVYSPLEKGENSCEDLDVFTWRPPRSEVVSFHPVKTDIQALRFFGPGSTQISQKVFVKRSRNIPSASNNIGSAGMVKWENPFNMRSCNLANFPTSTTAYRTMYRSQAVAMQRARLGCTTGSAKSLDILRQNLQKSINKEIDEILQRYLEKFFKPGIENIKINNGENSVSEQHVQMVCRQILEEAKKMYQGNYARGSSPCSEFHEVENPAVEIKHGRSYNKGFIKKRKDSDTDSEASFSTFKQKKKKGRPPVHCQGTSSGRSTPLKFKADQVKREKPKWDPERLTPSTLFIMGAKANKALGLGATRGRLYIKHPEIFKYSGDQEDKQWLYDHTLMPATGGKAYMLLVDDIKELAESEEYRNNPALMLEEIVGFIIPDSMLQKMKNAMQQMRTDIPAKKRGRPPTVNADSSSEPSISHVDMKLDDITSDDKHDGSGAATPTDELDLLSVGMRSTDPSPFSLSAAFEDVSPAQTEISPAPSDLSTTLEPPSSATFDISDAPL